MRRGAAHIKIFDGSAVTRPARDGTQKEKLLERQFALKNIPFGEADLLFDVEGRENLAADNDVFQVGRKFGNGVDYGVAEFFAARGPIAIFQFVRRVL